MGRGGGAGSERGEHQALYCIVPRELAAKLHDQLRRHFRDDPEVEVVVERRAQERRAASARREPAADRKQAERRSIRGVEGRRVADRRAVVIESARRELPRRLQRHAERLVFVERLAPTSQHEEDVDTARLVIRLQAGEQAAFSDLYLRYFDRVYSYLRVMLNDHGRAEDVTQHVFVKILAALPTYERRTQPFRAWIFRIARNEAVDELRHLNRVELAEPDALDRRREETDEPAMLEGLDWISDRELLMFVERLPLPQRQALMLRFGADLSDVQIGEILGRTAVDVRMLQSRGLRFLRSRLTAVGRGPRQRGGRIRMRRQPREATVLRARRWALHL